MSSINVDGLFVEIGTNTDSGVTTMNLLPAERRVALSMGVPLEDVAALKRVHGRKGLAGVALHSGPRATSPFSPSKDWRPSNSRVAEDDQDEDHDRMNPIFNPRPMGVAFPDGRKPGSR
jgi:hypothetical protein